MRNRVRGGDASDDRRGTGCPARAEDASATARPGRRLSTVGKTPQTLITALRRELRGQADPGKAPAMQAYMKSRMPYYGIQTQRLREIERGIFSRFPLADFESWRATVLGLWRGARYREERYAAIGLTGWKSYEAFQTLQTLPMYEELIVTGAWWDYVDSIAAGRLGPLLRRYPAAMKRRMRQWRRSPDMWKRRSAILCQLTFKADTDLDLLYECILANAADPEFFIRKAIGWALRQYAWTDPQEVARFVSAHADQLSGLSRREALKNVDSGRSRRGKSARPSERRLAGAPAARATRAARSPRSDRAVRP